MRKNVENLIIVLSLLALAGCNSKGPTWSQVRYKSGPVVEKEEGYLKVFSQARVYNDGDVPQVTRLPYTIYSADGKKIQFVAFNDEDPQLVVLPAGRYVIVPGAGAAKSDVYGAVLSSGRLTEVHMKGENPMNAPLNF